MSSQHQRIVRVLTPVVAAAALYVGSAAACPAAWAHVHASADNPVRGARATVTFQVPNESDKGAATTALTVTLPNVASASTEAMPGWTARLDRDAASGSVRSVTWTAAPNAGIGVDQFALFRIAVQLPDAETVSFPAAQTYSDGTVVNWDQPPQPGGGEPEHPAPMLTLGGRSPASHVHGAPPRSESPDTTARALAGVALAVAAAGLALALVRRRS
ncbi:YcnI family protein [Mycobacterium palustre]|uniref:Nuclear export factor GLE1 n=1 Tax=Mycobacterium palustre TaxID=153971 RepID=A0A1X2A183_9MYCO|nr:YcnI family protein [Mycobacterium palustre]MCV7101229.1 YcnI family protein [Mycobacterium palustre]ORW34824.1 nuclear export factor GLE1 [Mycobacterium palustre]ORW34842.1 nuclear export factor GLE1 [Mycobacterium palustre]